MSEHTRNAYENGASGNGTPMSRSGRTHKKECDLWVTLVGEEVDLSEDVKNIALDFFDCKLSNTGERCERIPWDTDLKDVELSTLKDFIDVISSCIVNASEKDFEEILRTARLMECNRIVHKVSEHLQHRLNETSFFKIRNMAIKYSSKSLHAVCEK